MICAVSCSLGLQTWLPGKDPLNLRSKGEHHHLTLSLLPARCTGKSDVSERWMQPHKQCERAFGKYLSKFKSKSIRTFSFALHSLWALREDCGDLQGLLPNPLPWAQEMWPLSRVSRAQAQAGGLLAQPLCCSHQGRAGWGGLKPARHICCHGRYPESRNILDSHITLALVSPAKLCLAKNAPNTLKPPHLQGGSPVTVQVTCLWNLTYWVGPLRYPARQLNLY